MVESLEAISQVFPIAARSIDSNNDNVLINETLVGYCEERASSSLIAILIARTTGYLQKEVCMEGSFRRAALPGHGEEAWTTIVVDRKTGASIGHDFEPRSLNMKVSQSATFGISCC